MAKVSFEYTARDQSGRTVKGKIEAESEDDAMGRLRGQGLSVVDMKRKGGRPKPKPKAKGGKGGFDINNLFGEPSKKANNAQLAMFTRQLATMLGAGIPLLEGIEILADQIIEEAKGFGNGLKETADMVRGGTALSEAMAQYPKIFPDIYVNMIKAGEASGQLDMILNRLADYMEASESLKREIKSAMTYPVISLVLILGITAYLLIAVVPKFEKMFKSLKAELPGLTKGVLFASKWSQNNWLLILGVFGAIAAVYWVVKTRPEVRGVVDTLMLRIPVFGPLNQKVAVSRFARTFSTLLSSGVPILGALEIVATTAGNKIIEDAVLETRETVRSGDSLTSHLETVWVFPPMVVRMIAIGEKSGALELLLTKIADFYDEQVHATVKSLTSLIEPIMISVMGTVVGTIVLAIFWPILELQKQLS
ncbi:MAG: type II secretion system F family protein [Planctomycetota bacterium]|nr:type II secretion system F family protein [Planctomycetota bacterium]